MASRKNTEFDPKNPRLTAGEYVRVGWNVARMCKRGIAGENVYQGDLEKKVDRIIDGARKRAEASAALSTWKFTVYATDDKGRRGKHSGLVDSYSEADARRGVIESVRAAGCRPCGPVKLTLKRK
ncbi:DUF6257 family protein [Streptomyces wedmorensis]|uniref:DUF6257 family protein n=1 Tax=Streptomyces wedmorensis TaxID=43759 RepID=UPI0034488452